MIAFVFIFVREDAPVDEFVGLGGVFDEALLWKGCAGGARAEFLPFSVFLFVSVGAVVDFSGGCSVVAVLGEMLLERDVVFEFVEVAEPGGEAVDAGGVGSEAEHEGGAGRVAEGRLAVRVGEESAGFGEVVDVGSFGVGVSVEAANPVVLIIDSDEENVRSALGRKS